jgi:3-hydroxy-9,10-secoandrosta-1,3,5(10)-triene-9,17-dione monooxygenase
MTVTEQAPSTQPITRPYTPPRLPAAQAGPEDEELVSRAADLVPLLSRHAAETERLRRLPDAVIDALQTAGLLRITIPRRFGGYQVSLETKVRVAAELARGCGSTSWTVSLINVCNWFTALYPERAQQDVWGNDPDARVAGVFTPGGDVRRVDGGQVVSGEWAWASGSLHANWAVIGIPMLGDDGTPVDAGLALVPMADLSIKDTWYTVGMRGTGSNTLVAQDVFIPDYRVMSFTRAFEGAYPREDNSDASYRSAFMPYATAILVGPQLGLARAAFDLVLAKSARRGIAYTVYQRQTDSPGFRFAMAEAALRIDGAYLHALRVIRDIDTQAANGPYPDYLARAHARAGISHAIKEAREAIRILVSAHGASSFAEVNDLQRIWRDSEVASRHAIASPETNADLFGSALVGLPEHNVTALV